MDLSVKHELDAWDGPAQRGVEAARRAIWEPLPDAGSDYWRSGIEPCLAQIVPHLEPALLGVESPTILDLGCGIGRLSLPIASMYPHGKVIGLDISPSMLSIAREAAMVAGVTNVDYVLCNGRDIPSSINKLHAAFSMITFQHMPWTAAAEYVRQVASCLLPVGVFRFQVSTGTEDVFLSHQILEEAAVLACGVAGLEVAAIDRGAIYPVWSWFTACRP